MLPIVTMIGMDIGLAFAAAVFVERVFDLPGVGSLLIGALGSRDTPVMLGIVVLITLVILVMNLIVDLVYTLIDPRVRHVRAARARADGGRARRRAAEPAVSAP